jgi:hypothetical protein
MEVLTAGDGVSGGEPPAIVVTIYGWANAGTEIRRTARDTRGLYILGVQRFD